LYQDLLDSARGGCGRRTGTELAATVALSGGEGGDGGRSSSDAEGGSGTFVGGGGGKEVPRRVLRRMMRKARQNTARLSRVAARAFQDAARRALAGPGGTVRTGGDAPAVSSEGEDEPVSAAEDSAEEDSGDEVFMDVSDED